MNPNLKKNEPHLWKIRVSDFNDKINYFSNLLSVDEKKRAQKFRFEKDRNCYIIARGCLRLLLSRYCKIESGKIQFYYSKNNKPYIKDHSNIKFNVSHSKDVIIIGFNLDHEIGVDVEKVDLKINYKEIATSFFSQEEITELMGLSDAYRAQGFFNCWTRKEAFIKALGDGLSFPLDQFAVNLSSIKYANLVATKWDPNEKSKWFLQPFSPFKNYIGAIAIKGIVDNVKLYDFKDKH